jgi:hypothetical protein
MSQFEGRFPSEAKAPLSVVLFGTAEAVPFKSSRVTQAQATGNYKSGGELFIYWLLAFGEKAVLAPPSGMPRGSGLTVTGCVSVWPSTVSRTV